MALSGKPEPGRGRSKAAVPLPEPSADLVLQRAVTEPKPRPQPRSPPVTPQPTGIPLQIALNGSAFCLLTAGLRDYHGTNNIHCQPAAFAMQRPRKVAVHQARDLLQSLRPASSSICLEMYRSVSFMMH